MGKTLTTTEAYRRQTRVPFLSSSRLAIRKRSCQSFGPCVLVLTGGQSAEVTVPSGTSMETRGGRDLGKARNDVPSMISLGSTTLPSDLLILYPFSSSTNPCVKMVLYGATPFAAAITEKKVSVVYIAMYGQQSLELEVKQC